MAHDFEHRLLVLRTMMAGRAYLDNYPIAPGESADIAWLTLPEWLAEGDDADEDRFALAVRLGYPAVRLRDYEDRGAADAITPELARRLRAIPLQNGKGLVAVALEDCENPEALQQLNFLLRDRVVPMVSTPRTIRECIGHFYDHDQDLAVARQLGLDPLLETPQRDMERLAREKPVVRIVTDLIAEAVSRRASDIHIRPGEQGADVLYRIDDELVPVRRFLRALLPAVVSRIKVLADMNLAEHRKPQDGRTSFLLDNGRKVDLRISVMPAVFGESVVVRLLDTMESLWNIDQLGLSPADHARLDDVMSRSHGMFLTTGPTGCGKSTTLYAMLLELRKQRINILTIEDPVEFYVEDIQQMQVNRAADFTFATAMRNFLRHDPDVIMVGEMRDRETAAIGVESALTGHLVLSTLHTNTAAATITRLLDLGVEAYLLRASLLAVMAQRLARLTCLHCREVEQVAPHIRETLGVGADEVFYSGRGCSRCEGLGVKKRRAVYELMLVTPAIQRLIVPGAEADTIHATAIEQGMTPLTQAAVQLARSGAISLTEAWRLRAD
ncbi:MAG: type II/IV secretion system protein [Xanthomonadales bacterium]|nr:type II/IV secretion system protein [Xanthomonadales bacterium]